MGFRFRYDSAAANRDDDFQIIAMLQGQAVEAATRDDFAVAFNRQAFTAKLEQHQQFADGKRLAEFARLAIDGQGNHVRQEAKKKRILTRRRHAAVPRTRLMRTTTGSWRNAFITLARCARCSTCRVKLSVV